MHILTSISKSKGNQTMKFVQLIECNMRNIFLENSYTKCCGETILILNTWKVFQKAISVFFSRMWLHSQINILQGFSHLSVVSYLKCSLIYFLQKFNWEETLNRLQICSLKHKILLYFTTTPLLCLLCI